MPLDQNAKTASLYRMVMPGHICPYGLKSRDLLERNGFAVEDHHLTTREETDAFKEKHGVGTTPQTFIDGDRIGGYDDLRAHFGKKVKSQDETSYKPVITIFSVAFLMALAVSWYVFGNVFTVRAFEWFIAISMCILAIQKLQDIESFSTMFLNYDLLARRWVRYGYLYPFGGFVSLTENLMIATAIWMALRMFGLG